MIQLTDKVYAVEVPLNSKKHHISFTGKIATSIDQSIFFKHEDEDELDEWTFRDLPPGSCRFLFATKTVTEEDARKVVRELPVGARWMNYNGDYPVWYHTGKESLRSLIRSKGLDPNKNYALIEKEITNDANS